jgi:hypothetical protein
MEFLRIDIEIYWDLERKVVQFRLICLCTISD